MAIDLLEQFHGTPLAHRIKTLWVIGAYRFEERHDFDRLFPHLSEIYLFEPIPELFRWLEQETLADARVRVFDYAVADFDGNADFFVTNNQASSSLLKLGRHLEVFPHVHHIHTISVQAQTVGTIMQSQRLAAPDLLFMDAQGAELKVISGVPPLVLEAIHVIHLEASLEELYSSSGTLRDITAALESYFYCCGFSPFPGYPTHGDALFVNLAKNI